MIEMLLDSEEGESIFSVKTAGEGAWEICRAEMRFHNADSVKGTHAIYFRVKEGILDFAEFQMN